MIDSTPALCESEIRAPGINDDARHRSIVAAAVRINAQTSSSSPTRDSGEVDAPLAPPDPCLWAQLHRRIRMNRDMGQKT